MLSCTHSKKVNYGSWWLININPALTLLKSLSIAWGFVVERRPNSRVESSLGSACVAEAMQKKITISWTHWQSQFIKIKVTRPVKTKMSCTPKLNVQVLYLSHNREKLCNTGQKGVPQVKILSCKTYRSSLSQDGSGIYICCNVPSDCNKVTVSSFTTCIH